LPAKSTTPTNRRQTPQVLGMTQNESDTTNDSTEDDGKEWIGGVLWNKLPDDAQQQVQSGHND